MNFASIKKKKIAQNLNTSGVALLMVKNGTMHFVLPFSQKLWQKQVPYKKHLKIQFNFLPKKDTIPFSLLPGDEASSALPKFKTAVLLENKNNHYFGFLVDTIEGVFYIKPQLLEKQEKTLKTKSGLQEKFLVIKGKRYYFRNIEI